MQTKRKPSALDDVNTLNLRAKGLLASFGRQVLDVSKMEIADPEVLEKVKLTSNTIERDIREYNTKITEVEKDQKVLATIKNPGKQYHKALVFGGQYVELIDNIHNTIGGSAIDLTELVHQYQLDRTDQLSQQQPT